MANSILQLNWSEYITRIRSDQFPNDTLIYIQDKGFYIQTSNDISRTAVTQYFVVYGNVDEILNETNGLPGLYVLVKGTTTALLYYHDGQTAGVQVSGSSSGGGNVGAIKINGDTYTANTEGIIDISDKAFAQLYNTNDAAKNAVGNNKPGATGYVAGIVDGGGW